MPFLSHPGAVRTPSDAYFPAKRAIIRSVLTRFAGQTAPSESLLVARDFYLERLEGSANLCDSAVENRMFFAAFCGSASPRIRRRSSQRMAEIGEENALFVARPGFQPSR